VGEAGSWDRQLRRLDEIAANLDRAETLAGQDVARANTAIAEIAEAARVIREARAYYQSGIAVDVSAAESQLNRARGSLKTLAYEQAIEQANAAEHQAREAFDRAAYAARRRQMDAQRGRAFGMSDALTIAAAHAAAHLAGRWIESMARGETGPASGGGDRTSWGGGSWTSGGGTWGSGSSGGSWTSGADEGRW
jgi:hypothetical protein